MPDMPTFEIDPEQYLDYVARLARNIAKKLPSEVEYEELEGFGRLGLMEAHRRFDPSLGVSFQTFAYYRIRGAIFDNLRRMTDLPPGVRMTVASDEVDDDDSEHFHLEQVVLSGEKDRVSAAEAFRKHVRGLAVRWLLSEASTAWTNDEQLTSIDHETPDGTAERRELVERVSAAISTLPKEDFDLVRRIYYEGVSITDIAQNHRVHKSTISRKHRAIIEDLKQCVFSSTS